jgi:ABC-type branched-subunit amino acid transport system permease subunit
MTEAAAPPRTNTLALVAFIAAFMIPVAGLVIGIVARNQLSQPGSAETGRGFARWAMIIGGLGTLFGVVFFAIWLSLFITAISRAPVW